MRQLHIGYERHWSGTRIKNATWKTFITDYQTILVKIDMQMLSDLLNSMAPVFHERVSTN